MTNLKVWEKELGKKDFRDKVVVSSRTVAKMFGKRHVSLLRTIDAFKSAKNGR